MRPSPLPQQLPAAFSVTDARRLGVSDRRLRASDLEVPFRGVRVKTREADHSLGHYDLAALRERALIRALGSRLDQGQFFSHRSAALLWGVPLPHRRGHELHLSVARPQRAPRIRGVIGHSLDPARVRIICRGGLPVAGPAETFAMLGGTLSVPDLVAVGDYLVRQYRAGYGRPHTGRPPIAQIDELAEAVGLGRWAGAPKLRRALELIREDSWSPRESWTRWVLVTAGLPEPELNIDLFDRAGGFLGCVDMVYPRFGVVIEYQGVQHSATFAEDVERIERLRNAGWTVIQVTHALARRHEVLVARVARELRARGWEGLSGVA